MKEAGLVVLEPLQHSTDEVPDPHLDSCQASPQRSVTELLQHCRFYQIKGLNQTLR